MKIIIATGGGEPLYSSNQGLIYAFRSLGHQVCVIGPGYFGRNLADIPIEDIPHPELYSYELILNKVSWQPDLILNIEPHCFLSGPKSREIKSAFLATDIHRAGEFYYRIIKQGSFDFVFLAQKYFLPLFMDLPTKVHYLPVGFDERRFPQEDSYWQKEPECDIVFIGQTGLAGMEYPYRDDIGRYAITTPYIHGPEKFAFGFHPGYDYAERGELLFRLCRDLFSCRIYEAVWDTPGYFRALRKGTIGFHCSLLHDLSIRCLEIAAAGRLLVTDQVEDIWDILSVKDLTPHVERRRLCPTYKLHYKPFFPNFDLTYKELHRTISYWLLHDRERETLAAEAKEHVWKGQSWRHRAQSILETVFN